MQAGEDIIVGLDIGTTKICCVVGEIKCVGAPEPEVEPLPDQHFEPKALKLGQGQGFEHGFVTLFRKASDSGHDLDHTAHRVRRCDGHEGRDQCRKPMHRFRI